MPYSETGNTEAMTALLRGIVNLLVDDPNGVSVHAVRFNDQVSLQVRVAPGDVGKLIGKQGRTARSIRTILSAASMKLHQSFALEILE